MFQSIVEYKQTNGCFTHTHTHTSHNGNINDIWREKEKTKTSCSVPSWRMFGWFHKAHHFEYWQCLFIQIFRARNRNTSNWKLIHLILECWWRWREGAIFFIFRSFSFRFGVNVSVCVCVCQMKWSTLVEANTNIRLTIRSTHDDSYSFPFIPDCIL